MSVIHKILREIDSEKPEKPRFDNKKLFGTLGHCCLLKAEALDKSANSLLPAFTLLHFETGSTGISLNQKFWKPIDYFITTFLE